MQRYSDNSKLRRNMSTPKSAPDTTPEITPNKTPKNGIDTMTLKQTLWKYKCIQPKSTSEKNHDLRTPPFNGA